MIAINAQGDFVMDCETNLMFRAFKKGNEPQKVLVWREEECEYDNIRKSE